MGALSVFITYEKKTLPMKALVARSPVGLFAFDEKGKLIAHSVFKPGVAEAMEAFLAPLPKDFLLKLKGYDVEESEAAQGLLRPQMRKLAIQLGFARDDAELNRFLSAFTAEMSRQKAKGSISRDRLVVQASNALEDVSKALNSLLMRISEWYGLHYPELKTSYERLLQGIVEYGRRENWPEFVDSTGAELSEKDEQVLKDFAYSAFKLSESKKALEHYVREAMKEIAPNFSSLVDPLLAAKILSAAGSMEKLSKLSASSIQLIGAEKALFRHLKKKGKAPKYGLLFNSSWVQSVPDEQKGKAARALAAKLMMAIRIDFFSKRDEAAKLKEDLEKEIRGMKK
jgi:nucleolar protein 56